MSFIESATLKVIDESSAQINKINAELKKLASTTKALKSTSINFNIKDSGVTKATAEIHKLATAAKELKGLSANLTFKDSGVSKMIADVAKLRSEMTALRNAMQQPVTLRANTAEMQRQMRTAAAQTPVARRGVLGTAAIAAGTFVGNAATQVVHHVYEAAKEGTRAVDIGDTALRLKSLSGEQRRMSEDLISQILTDEAARPGGAIFSRGEISQRYAESLDVVRAGDPKLYDPKLKALRDKTIVERTDDLTAAALLTDRTNELSAILEKTGLTHERASEGAIYLSKGLEQLDWLTDPSGRFNVKSMNTSFDFLGQLIKEVGREMTGPEFFGMARNLRGAKYGLGQKGIAQTAFLYEDMKQTAASEMRLFVQQITGHNLTNEAKREQERLGLVAADTAQMTGGGKLKQQGRNLIYPHGVAHEKEWYTDPVGAFQKYIVPAWQKMYPQYDLTKAADLESLSNKLVSQPGARDMLQAIGLRYQELESRYRSMTGRAGDVDTLRKEGENSVLGAITSLHTGVTGVLGEGIKAVFPLVQQPIQLLSQKLAEYQQDLAKAREKGVTGADLEKLAITGLEGVAAAYVAKKTLLDPIITPLMGAMATPVGLASGAMGAMSRDPATRSLSYAGIALIEAAGELKSAAGALAGAGMPGGLPTPDQTKNNEATKDLVKNAEEKAGWLTSVLRFLNSPAARILGAAGVVGTAFWPDETGTAKERERAERLAAARRAIEQAEVAKQDLELQRQKREQMGVGTSPAMAQEIQRLNDLIEQSRKIIEQNTVKPPPSAAPAVPFFTEQGPHWADPDKIDKLFQNVPPPDWLNPSKSLPSPFPPPPWLTPPVATGAGARPTDQISLTGLDEFTSRFQTVLGGIGQGLIDGGATAGQYLAAGGEAAAATLKAEAGSIGSAIGSAAAAVISAAHVNVSVPTTVASKVDPGAQKVD